MFKERFPHFVTGDFKPQNVFLKDTEYALALDCLVKGCTDLMILDSSAADCHVLLGRRIVEPQPDWWFMGGRMKPGETPEASVARLTRRELGLDLPPSSFRLLGAHSYAWERRQQPPQEHGTCDVSIIFTLIADRGTVADVAFDEKEYGDIRWFPLSEVMLGEQFHPALRSAARDVGRRHMWEKLVAAVTEHPSDPSLIAAAATELVDASK